MENENIDVITENDILEFISSISVLELSELVKEFEEKFGVTATPSAEAFAFRNNLLGETEEE
jgi:large subunit ribosomal protein L7/L12